jgi:hypothetical protein
VETATLVASISTDPTNGTVIVVGNVATYTPNADFVGTDVWTYVMNDGSANSAEATVDITVYDPETFGESMSLNGAVTDGNALALSWSTVSGATYGVAMSTNLVSGPWTNVLTGISGDGIPVSITNDPTADQQFFRVYLEE